MTAETPVQARERQGINRTPSTSHGSRRTAGSPWWAVTLLVLLASCGGGPPVDSDGYILLNNGWPDQLEVSLVAADYVRDPHRTVSFGTGTIENIGDRPVTIVDVAPLETFGGIELVDVIVNGRDRYALWIAADEVFPPREGLGTTAPAVGYVIEPPTGAFPHRSVNIVQGYRVPPSSSVAGVLGFCVTYLVDGIEDERRRCWPNHALLACEDVDDPACVGPDG